MNGDTNVETNEAFTVHLSNVVNATISDADGTGTIVNDDAASFSIDDVTHNEGNSGTTAFTFTVTISGLPLTSASVKFQAQDGSATTEDNDYQAKSGTLTFTSTGALSQQVTVLVNGDTTLNRAFTVHLSNAVNATISRRWHRHDPQRRCGANSISNSNRHCDCNCNSHTHGYGYGNSYADRYCHSHGYSYSYGAPPRRPLPQPQRPFGGPQHLDAPARGYRG